MLFEICGWLSAVCFVGSYVPQLYRTHRLKEVDSFSPWLWLLLFIGHTLGVFYSIHVIAFPWILGNTIGAVCSWWLLLQWVIYRDPKKDELRNIVSTELKNMKRRLK
jgi:uncharacterized protein with PQ loop repeat